MKVHSDVPWAICTLCISLPAPGEAPVKEATEPAYSCPSVTDRITVDGNLDEPAWKMAESLSFKLPASGDSAISKTEGRILWDENYLYVGFKAYDQDIGGSFTRRDSPTYKEDVLETFLMPGSASKEYFNIEINTLLTPHDQYHGRPRKYPHPSAWNCEGLRVQVQIEGTLNQPKDKDQYWQMELAIPFRSIPVLEGHAPKAGDRWRFHLARYDYSVYLPGE